MGRRVDRRVKDVGLPPGTLVFVGTPRTGKTRISVVAYTPEHVEERTLSSPEEAFPYRDAPLTSWINVEGLEDVSVIERIGTHFGLHPLVQEDILNTGQRPKVEVFENCLYIVMKMLRPDTDARTVIVEQVSLVLGRSFVLSFQEAPGDVFDPVRARLRNPHMRIRNMGADFLAYALVDAVVDGYFVVLEKLDEMAESLEQDVLEEPTATTLRTIQLLRTDTIVLRKAASPLREVINGMRRDAGHLVSEGLELYLSDVYDHTMRVAESLEALRDTVGGLRDTYVSTLSNRMNEIMKVLTVIATIFIPLTFIAGVYGMNFDPDASPYNMPELRSPWGYPASLAVMAAVAGGMLYYFRRKRWL